MAANPASEARGGSFLLELLYFAGWHLQVRDRATATIDATRADVELEVSGASLADAAGTIFARAMRSNRRRDRGEEG